MQNINTLLNSCWWIYLNTAKQDKRIQYLSPIPGSKPGWYFWLEKNPGVYEMIFSESKTEANQEESSFVLKYYPSPDEAVFETFSCAEQIVRLSDFFDDAPMEHSHNGSECACSQICSSNDNCGRNKGFPRFHARKQINESQFEIGKITFKLVSEKLREMKYISQDKTIQYSVEGIEVPQQDGSVLRVLEPWSEDRSIPAWEIGWQFYKLLIEEVFPELGMLSQGFKRDTEPGYLYYQEKEGEIWFALSDTVTQITHVNYF